MHRIDTMKNISERQKVGIDAISFYTTQYYLKLKDLATYKAEAETKYTHGLGQEEMAIITPKEDIVTMACEAVNTFISDEIREKINLILFATESGIDYSKSAGIYVQNLLDIQKECEVVELKQACYSGTVALRMANNHVLLNPESKALVICSDIAWYGLNTPGEPTQGCGAVAMLISANPKIIAFDSRYSPFTSNEFDFWRPARRPSHMQIPLVDGKASMKIYFNHLKHTFENYNIKTQSCFADYSKFCFHLPFAKMANKSYEILCSNDENGVQKYDEEQFQSGKIYAKTVGNIYTGSLYLSLCSLLENTGENLGGKKIGMFSYGSGATSAFFSGNVIEGYQQYLSKDKHNHLLKKRKSVHYDTYQKLWEEYAQREYGSDENFMYEKRIAEIEYESNTFLLNKIENGKRIYEKTSCQSSE